MGYCVHGSVKLPETITLLRVFIINNYETALLWLILLLLGCWDQLYYHCWTQRTASTRRCQISLNTFTNTIQQCQEKHDCKKMPARYGPLKKDIWQQLFCSPSWDISKCSIIMKYILVCGWWGSVSMCAHVCVCVHTRTSVCLSKNKWLLMTMLWKSIAPYKHNGFYTVQCHNKIQWISITDVRAAQ